MALFILALTSGISVGIGLLARVAHLEGWGSWLGVFLAGIALVTSAYAIALQTRQGESTNWHIALGRIGALYDLAHEDPRLSSLVAEPSDPHGTSIVEPVDITPSPQETVWFGSLFLAFEQLFIATLTLPRESQRVCRLYLKNHLNKPSIRAAFVRYASDGHALHGDFWRFVRGVPCDRDGTGYRNYAIHPKFFQLADRRSSNLPVSKIVAVKPFEPSHAPFWLEMYRDDTVKTQMYAAPTSSEKELIDYLSQRKLYTVFTDGKPIGGFSLTEEKDGIGTFGIVLHPTCRGQGYSHQIMRELELKAQEHGLFTLRADVYSDNYPCIRALERRGFRRFIWFEKNMIPHKAADSQDTRVTPPAWALRSWHGSRHG